MRRLILSIALAGLARAACAPVHGARILASDLAAVDERFSALPAMLVLGYAPAAGTQRVIAGPELERVARANGIALDSPAPVCFEVPRRMLTQEEIANAMQASLPPGERVQILEFEKGELPEGELVFPLGSLAPPRAESHGEQIWRGHVKYAGRLEKPVWARVRVTSNTTVAIAMHDLAAGTVILPSDLKTVEQTMAGDRRRMTSRPEEAVSRMLRRAVKAGEPIPVAGLDERGAVRRGDVVHVEVRSGLARIRFDAVANGPANEGQMIPLRNPVNGKSFHARLGEGARAVVEAGGANRP